MDIRTLKRIMKVNSTITVSQSKEIEQILLNYNVNEGNIIVKEKIKKKRNKKQVVMFYRK